jgi:hypothetical protein
VSARPVGLTTTDGRERAQTFGRKADADRFAASVETDKARGKWIDPRLGTALDGLYGAAQSVS